MVEKLFNQLKYSIPKVLEVIAISAVASLIIHIIFIAGYLYGFGKGTEELSEQINKVANSKTVSSTVQEENEPPTPTPRTIVVQPNIVEQVAPPNWSGPELWEAVNARRLELGVNGMANQAELCTIASIRLNELLELGKLDGHEGFGSLPERREDLKWIFEKYNISEFLVSGANSAQEAVDLWENTLGHKKLLTGGEYVWGCTYAQNSFGVAIAAY
jgi:uncharacterized protein YkwD